MALLILFTIALICVMLTKLWKRSGKVLIEQKALIHIKVADDEEQFQSMEEP